MDEGRRMILLFPTLIDFNKIPSANDGDSNGERSEEDAQKLRDGFYPEYVRLAVYLPGPSNAHHCLAAGEETEHADSREQSSCHIFYSDRKVDIPDGKPKWKGLDGADGVLCDKTS